MVGVGGLGGLGGIGLGGISRGVAVAAPVAVASGAVSYQNNNQISLNPTPVIAKIAAPVAVAAPVAAPVAVGVAPIGVGIGKNTSFF